MKRLSNKYGKNSKNNKFNKILHLEREKIKNGFVKSVYKFRKNRKSNKTFPCYVKRLSTKYGKNSKNNKFNKILHLEREKVKKGFEKSANFAKNRKINNWRLFLAMWKDWVINIAKIARIANFTKFNVYKKKRSKKEKKANKCRKNNKFSNRIKVKRDLLWSANYAKFAKETRISLQHR